MSPLRVCTVCRQEWTTPKQEVPEDRKCPSCPCADDGVPATVTPLVIDVVPLPWDPAHIAASASFAHTVVLETWVPKELGDDASPEEVLDELSNLLGLWAEVTVRAAHSLRAAFAADALKR